MTAPAIHGSARIQQRIYDELARVPGRIVTMRELEDACYFDHPDGGPVDAAATIRRILFSMVRNGVPIVTHRSRGRSLANPAPDVISPKRSNGG